MKKQLEARLEELNKQVEQALANLNYLSGARDEITHVLRTLNEPPVIVDKNAD